MVDVDPAQQEPVTNDGTGPIGIDEPTVDVEDADKPVQEPPFIDIENPPAAHVAPAEVHALSNPVPHVTTNGTKDHFTGYQIIPVGAEIEIAGEVIKGEGFTHVQALKIMSQRPRWFAANVHRARYPADHEYWKGYTPKKG